MSSHHSRNARSVGFDFELVPSIEDVPSRHQGAKLPVGAALAEHISDLIKIVRQEFARKIQYQRLAEVKLPPVGNGDVFLFILDVVQQFVV